MRGFMFVSTGRTSHPLVDDILGKDWLDQRIKKAVESVSGRAGIDSARMGRFRSSIAHTLVSEGYHRAIGSDLGFTVGPRTPEKDQLEDDLTVLYPDFLPPNLRSRLRNPDEFDNVVHELRIAAGFVRQGQRIFWIPPGANRRPEFAVIVPGGNVVVECKKRNTLDGPSDAADRFWLTFADPMQRAMEKNSLNYWVMVRSSNFRSGDVSKLVQEIVNGIGHTPDGSLKAIDGNYDVEFVKISEIDADVDPEVIEMFPKGSHGVNASSRRKDAIERSGPGYEGVSMGPAKNPRLIRMDSADEPDRRVRTVLNQLSDAAKQVGDTTPSIVYLDVNVRNIDFTAGEFEDIVRAVQDRLRVRHSNISAVVVMNYYGGMSQDLVFGWRLRTELVKNSRATNPLPDTFGYPGDDNDVGWMGRDFTAGP